MNQTQRRQHYGSLMLDMNNCYVLQEDGTEKIVHIFSTGDPIQIWLGGQWIEGRIEAGGEKHGYYFLSNDSGFAGLMYGMRARIVQASDSKEVNE